MNRRIGVLQTPALPLGYLAALSVAKSSGGTEAVNPHVPVRGGFVQFTMMGIGTILTAPPSIGAPLVSCISLTAPPFRVTESRPDLARVVPVEAHEAVRRHRYVVRPEGIDDGLEEANHWNRPVQERTSGSAAGRHASSAACGSVSAVSGTGRSPVGRQVRLRSKRHGWRTNPPPESG